MKKSNKEEWIKHNRNEIDIAEFENYLFKILQNNYLKFYRIFNIFQGFWGFVIKLIKKF